MRFVATIIWAFVLSAVAAFVLSSMSGDPYDMSIVIVMTVIFSLGIWTLSAVLPKGEEHE
nr:YjzD family protein [Terribacillus saccharophilus]